MKVKLPDSVPGVVELKGMCEAARQVNELCGLMGMEFRGAPHMIAQLETLAEETGLAECEIGADGQWILPEEVPDSA